jgi:ribose/xylose/arabinose/galactoside ABC-type transport system permease subunit
MLNLVIFIVGLFCGIVGTVLVARNNKTKASDAVGKL